MKRMLFVLGLAVLCFCCFNIQAMAQDNYTEGSVWRVTLIDIKPGRNTEFWQDVRQNLKPIWEEYKKAGIIVNYTVDVKTTTDEPGDWDVAFRFEYKNFAALDGLLAKTDPITLKFYGTADARREAGVKRAENGTTVASLLMRQVTPKDLPK
jgi:hypothetical protein